VTHTGPSELIAHREPGLPGTDHNYIDPIAHRSKSLPLHT
jgi:hypothetical protein